MIKISLEKLLETSAHFGHQARRWNPKMAPYIYGEQEGVHVFDLTKTKAALEEALETLKKFSSEDKVILFVGCKKQSKDKTKEVAQAVNTSYVTERWLGGTLSNFDQIKRSINKLIEMKKKKAEGAYDKFTKKERLLLDREIERLERFFGGITTLEKHPDLLVIIDTHKESGAVKEANRANVPVIGIVDSNADPTIVDWPIPMNDDAGKAIEYVLDLMKEAILEGNKKMKKVESSK